jgi:hypothetical protein
LWAQPNDGSTLFAADATFCARASLVGDGAFRSFESKNLPNYYLRHAGGRLRIDPFADNAVYRADASWRIDVR